MAKAPGASRGPGPYEAELPLDLGDRLPWLEGDEDAERDAGAGRVIALLGLLLILIGMAAGGIWYFHHRQQQEAMAIAGGVIKAPPGPYKVRPANPGGSIAQGTGDTAYFVAQGKTLRGEAENENPVDLATPGPAVVGASTTGASGVGVQVGAYGTKDDAEKAWPALGVKYPILSGLSHRVVETPGDLGTVFGLQAVTATSAGANNLWAQLRAGGLKCEVKG